MSGHCPKCGDYCEEDDSRRCAKCATTPDERKAAEEWARNIARDLGADFLPAPIGDHLTSTKLAAMEAERLRAELAAMKESAKGMVRLPEISRGSAVLITRAKCNGLFVAEWFGDANRVCSDHMTTGDSPAAALSALTAKIEQEKK